MEHRFDRFTSIITSIFQSIQKIKSLEMERYGLKAGHVTCLHHLNSSPDGLTLVQLTKLCEMDKAAVSRYMSALQEKGLVARENTENKKYRRIWSLTEAGRAIAIDLDGSIEDAVDAVGFFLTESDRLILYKDLELIDANLMALIDTRYRQEGN